MGNVTAKTSGDIASFMTPAETNIKSLKVHFSPKQLGEGDPSPENVREIVGWDGVEVNGCGKNIAHIVGYSATNLASSDPSLRKISNNYGTTISTTDFSLPDTKIIVTQSSYTTEYDLVSYRNGYFAVIVDNLDFTKRYNVSFNVDVTSNPLNVDLSRIRALSPAGTGFEPPAKIDGNRLFFKNVPFTPHSNFPNRKSFEIRNAGMSFTLSEFMVTPVDDENFEYKPYQGNTISYQWKLPDEYQEVEYIESTGTQYIKTNISTDNLVSVDLLAQFTESSDVSQVLFSASTNGVNWFGQRDNVYACGSSGIQKSTVDSTQKSKIHIAFNNNSIVCMIGSNIFSRTDSQHQNGQLYKLFNIDYPSKAKVFYCIIYNDDITIANLVPCYRKSDNEIGMYDTVSQMFYTNRGTGKFLKGEDVDKTFYGGYVDLISGELVEESKLWIKNTSEMDSANSNFSGWYNCGIKSIIGEVNKAFYLNANSLYMLNVGTYFTANTTGSYDNLYLPNSRYGLTQDEWKEKAIDVKIVAPLATPITHQFTPTQLSSFIGQNNFWSNADYVEIEYELKETEDIQKARKKIILNQPQLKSISDKIASFNTDMVAPLKNCKIYFNPIQLGSGDPSPTNVRNINGWTSIDSYANGNKVSVDWTNDIGTVYGGYVDLVKGELIAEYESISDTWGNWGTLYDQGDGTELRYKKFTNSIIGGGAGSNSSYCNIAKYKYSNTDGTIHFYNVTTSNNCCIYLPSGTDISLQIQVVAKLAEPIHYQLTPQQLLTFKSTNHIWSETNGQQIDVKYWTHKNLTPTPLTNYLENQTWTDSAYISSSGKKTTNTVSASHFLTNQILLEAGTYVLSGFSHYVGTDNTNFRIHAYDSTGKWLRQIAYKQIGNLSPVDISFTLDTDTYVNVSIAMDFDGVLAKIN